VWLTAGTVGLGDATEWVGNEVGAAVCETTAADGDSEGDKLGKSLVMTAPDGSTLRGSMLGTSLGRTFVGSGVGATGAFVIDMLEKYLSLNRRPYSESKTLVSSSKKAFALSPS
jgi:hypothetical protein